MNVDEAIKNRRAYRSLKPFELTDDLIYQLSESAQLAPSCFNNQPWHFVFVTQPDILKKMHTALSKGNEWATHASMMIAVVCKKDDDCKIKDREYFLFDTGLATAHMILSATDSGLVCHPIAGFSPSKTKEILTIPDDFLVISLLIVGKKNEQINSELSEKQSEAEKLRPPRKKTSSFCFLNSFQIPIQQKAKSKEEEKQ